MLDINVHTDSSDGNETGVNLKRRCIASEHAYFGRRGYGCMGASVDRKMGTQNI